MAEKDKQTDSKATSPSGSKSKEQSTETKSEAKRSPAPKPVYIGLPNRVIVLPTGKRIRPEKLSRKEAEALVKRHKSLQRLFSL